jgi:hypothetical protein
VSLFDKLHERDLSPIALAPTEFQDPQVAAVPFRVAWAQCIEQLLQSFFVMYRTRSLAARVQVATSGQRDQMLGEGA